MDKIVEGLYLGNINAASDYKTLEKHGITHILRIVNGDYGKMFYDKFTYKIISVDDVPNSNLLKYFEVAHNFIDDAL